MRFNVIVGLRSYKQQKTAASEHAKSLKQETALSKDLAAARADVGFMKGQLSGLGVSVGKIGQEVGDNSSFIKLATDISNLSHSPSGDPTGLYDVSINGIAHQTIKIDHKIREAPQ